MVRRASLCAVIACVALFAVGKLAAQYDLVKTVTDRQAVMFEMQNAYWPLLKVDKGESTDLAAAAAASQSIEGAIDRFAALMVPGTAKGEVPGSRATPEVWTEPADFAAASSALQATAAELTAAASSGDIELFKARFDAFATACVTCHEFKPSGGGRFRAPK